MKKLSLLIGSLLIAGNALANNIPGIPYIPDDYQRVKEFYINNLSHKLEAVLNTGDCSLEAEDLPRLLADYSRQLYRYVDTVLEERKKYTFSFSITSLDRVVANANFYKLRYEFHCDPALIYLNKGNREKAAADSFYYADLVVNGS